MSIEPAKRVIAVALNIRPIDSAAAHFAGFDAFSDAILGLTPQALCWRPLRGLSESRSTIDVFFREHISAPQNSRRIESSLQRRHLAQMPVTIKFAQIFALQLPNSVLS